MPVDVVKGTVQIPSNRLLVLGYDVKVSRCLLWNMCVRVPSKGSNTSSRETCSRGTVSAVL